MEVRHLLILGASFAAVANSPASAATRDYGNAGLYSVTLNENGACAAIRSLDIRMNNGLPARKGAFGFGVLQFEGKFLGLITVMNPSWLMKKGQNAAGRIEVDSISHKALFFADSNNQLSAIFRLDIIKEIAFGKRMKINTGFDSYNFPLTGTAKVLPILARCVSDLAGSQVNPLGRDDTIFSGSRENPLER